MTPNPDQIRLVDLVEHADCLEAHAPLTAVQTEFARRARRFLGVTDGRRFVGVASGRQIAQVLSAQFGHALFGRNPVASHVMSGALVVTPETPLTELLKRAAARDDADFYSDIALVTREHDFVGLIPVHRLVRLQTSLLLANLEEVEEKRRELASRNRQMEDDLRMARQVQLALLPGKMLRLAHAGRACVVQHFYQPADLVGGDFCAVVELTTSSAGFFICDVMGHGVRPALITAIVCALLEEARELASDPGRLLSHLNRGLQRVLRGVGDLIFVTAGYGVVDLTRGELCYAQAGHPTPLLGRESSGSAAALALAPGSSGPALGLVDEVDYTNTVVPFGPGDALLLFTDGVLEVLGAEDAEFGPGRMRDAFARALVARVRDPVAEVLTAAQKFVGDAGFTDDVCLLMARCETD